MYRSHLLTMKKTIKIPSLDSLKNSPNGARLYIYQKDYQHCFVKHNDKWNEYRGHRFKNDDMRWYLEVLRERAPLYKVELKKN